MINPSKAKSFDRVVFTAMARENFFLREHIIKFVLQCGYTPNSAFMMFSYFLLDTVERKALIAANNQLIKRSDELWVFGVVSDGVDLEIQIAKQNNIPVRYFDFKINKCCTFCEIEKSLVQYKKY